MHFHSCTVVFLYGLAFEVCVSMCTCKCICICMYIYIQLYICFFFFPFVSCSLQMSDVLTKQRLLQNRLKCLKQDANDVENKQTNQDMFLYHSFFIVLCLMFCFVLLCFALFCFGTFTNLSKSAFTLGISMRPVSGCCPHTH